MPRLMRIERPGVSRRLIASAAGIWIAGLTLASGQRVLAPRDFRDHPNISYLTASVSDPVTRLNERIRRGQVHLDSEPTRGYLRSVLAALDVPVESQVLVFSKTSFQASRIGPQIPRAIYFNDRVSVGWVRGGDFIELAAQDPTRGTVFYTLAQPVDGADGVEFTRNNVNCVQCHTSDATLNIPGWFIGSVYPLKDGLTAYGPAYTTDHRTPFDIRWGGWYVTGSHHGERHLGNAVVTDSADLASMVTPATVHVTNLEGRFDPTGYLSTHSDIVALLVLEHQGQMLNHITRLGWEARMGKDAGRPLEQAAAALVDYLLFGDEAPLPGPIAGPTEFARAFSSKGPRDPKGRSLRDLQLTDRLMRYPCSYLIYSESFDALPAEAKALVYKRLWEVLSGQDTDARYRGLTSEIRRDILEILRATKPDLPDYFTSAAQ